MSNLFTLDSLREEVEKEFAPVEIGLSDGTKVVLRSLIRCDEKTRKAVTAELEGFNELTGDDENEDPEKVEKLVTTASNVLRLVAGSDGRKLIKELDGDIHLILKVLQTWMEATQPGEATSSPA